MTHCETPQLCRSWELRVVGVGMGVYEYLSSSPSIHKDEASRCHLLTPGPVAWPPKPSPIR